MASPIKFAHIVLKTSRFAEMLDWWKAFLEGEARHENEFISFISYDEALLLVSFEPVTYW